MKEYIQAVRAVWQCWQNEAPLLYEGETYRLSLMTPNFTPPPKSSSMPISQFSLPPLGQPCCVWPVRWRMGYACMAL